MSNQQATVAARQPQDVVRYAVVGLGWIAQAAMLPAFPNAGRNSQLAALVSGDATKRDELSRMYNVPAYSYEQYDECLQEVDAVYIATPDPLHREYAVRAAQAGVHVLCEKPMAVTSEDCRAMIAAAEAGGVKLMVAYRLHFDEANMVAVEVVQSGKLGEARIFNAVFSQQLAAGNVRLDSKLGDGTIYDLGVYCINAARYIFQAEPLEVVALRSERQDDRFGVVEEMASGLLRFPGDRLATFTSSFGAHFDASYRVVGTKAELVLDPGFGGGELRHRLVTGDKVEERTFAAQDAFAPQLLYFSDCILHDHQPEPDGEEGMIDVQIVEALYESARSGKVVKLDLPQRSVRPGPQLVVKLPPPDEPPMVNTVSPTFQAE